jgi:hypothetical protein
MHKQRNNFVKKITPLQKTSLKKRVPKPQPAPVQPVHSANPGDDTHVSFQRIHLRSFRQCRGTAAKLLKALVNQQLSPEVIKAAVQLLDRALAANNSILLQQRLESISTLLQMDAPNFEDEPDLPEEELEPGGNEED